MDYKYKNSTITTLCLYIFALITSIFIGILFNVVIGVFVCSLTVSIRALLSLTVFKNDIRRFPVLSGIVEGISFIIAFTLFWAIVI